MSTNDTCDLSTYTCSNLGLLLPIVNEYTWSVGGRATIYLIGLLWSFMGISIIADIFMSAIEAITSKTKTVCVADPSEESGQIEIEVKVWNSTVANLTLMALGSSAPEILLTCIEVIFSGFKAGDLGPSTVVGSAAFNLLVITGVCIMSIPKGEKRRIDGIKVFALTSFFSVIAYVWLILILVVITPDYVDLWEGIVTFLMFPILVVLAYLVDKECCRKKPQVTDTTQLGLAKIAYSDKSSKEVVANLMKKIHKDASLTEADKAKITAAYISEHSHHDLGWYRINAIRNLTGGPKLAPAVNEKQKEALEKLVKGDDVGASLVSLSELSEGGTKAVIEFAASTAAILEKDGRVKLTLLRQGNLKCQAIVKVETFDGTAEHGTDYKPFKESIVFQPEEASKTVEIEIIDDNDWEPDEVFFVRVSMADDEDVVIGHRSICQVTIVNDDQPGCFGFKEPSIAVKESSEKVEVEVERTKGVDGTVKVKWLTKDVTAIEGRDFKGREGELVFEHGETTKAIPIQIFDDQSYEKDEHFEVHLVELSSQGAKFGRLKKTIVTIMNDDEFNGMLSRLVGLTSANLDRLAAHKTTWGQQFRRALNVNDGDLDSAGFLDYALHFLTFGWKFIFALCPPPSILGGWLCFFVALLMIGVLTTLVSDLANYFGCLVGLGAPITAITLVALGTSLPDLFASRQAAIKETYADTAIGNITGSNSVNVFLGLGLGWFIASCYWTGKGQTFEVPAGDLSFSVVLYSIFAVLCIFVLVLRRFITPLGGAELGGPPVSRYICGIFCILLWVIYIVLASLKIKGHITTTF